MFSSDKEIKDQGEGELTDLLEVALDVVRWGMRSSSVLIKGLKKRCTREKHWANV